MVALDYFRRLGHDNHCRLSKLYAWEEKKSKTSWGAQTVDYEKRVSGFVLANPESKNAATAVVQAMKAADLNRFLVVSALVSDLYCPGYNPKQSLAKDSNLARTALRHKVNVVKITGKVKREYAATKRATKLSPKESTAKSANKGAQSKSKQ